MIFSRNLRERRTKMKLIWALIRPTKKKELEEALIKKGVMGITFEKVKCFGREEKMLLEPHELEHCKCELLVPDEWASWVIETIYEHTHTGTPGDGIIAVISVETVIDIVTGRKGEEVMREDS